MKTKIIFSIIIIIVIVFAVVFLRGGIKPSIETSTIFPYSSLTEAPGEKPSSPMQGVLTLLEKPLLNKPITLVFSFKSISPSPNTEARIELPKGFELVSGNLEWKGDLIISEEEKQKHPLPPTDCSGPECERLWKEYEYPSAGHKVEVVIKSTKIGYYRLSGSAISRQSADTYFGHTAVIDIEITPNDAIAGSKPKNNWYHRAQEQALPMAQNDEQIESELIFSNIPELNKNFTVTYKVTPLINLPSEKTYLNLVFPPKAFKLIEIQFPQGGETYERDTQLSWVGNIDVNQTMEITATFKVVNIGWGAVYGSLNSQSGKGGTGIDDLVASAKIADLYVDKYGGKFTK